MGDPKKLLRMDAKDVVQKAQQEMQHLKRHFLVVVLTDPEEPPKKDEDPVISIDLTDTRQNFLGQCQHQHWQFNSLRHAQYSTMMILQHIHNKPSYCLESCARGGVDERVLMPSLQVRAGLRTRLLGRYGRWYGRHGAVDARPSMIASPVGSAEQPGRRDT